MIKIGHIETSELWNVNHKRMNRFVNKLVPFFNIKRGATCLDMGEANPKMEYIKYRLKIDSHQVCGVDFNFDTLSDFYEVADTIFVLEVLEHLQNPLWFMREVAMCLDRNGRIYLTMPNSPRWAWMEGHYFEIPPKHFEKWILKPLGLEIVKQKKITFVHSLIPFGIRPLIRILKGKQSFKQTLRLIFHYKYHFYEIKKVSV